MAEGAEKDTTFVIQARVAQKPPPREARTETRTAIQFNRQKSHGKVHTMVAFKNFEQIGSRDLKGLSPEEFDAMAFGAIQLDQAGNITAYNRWEANLARRNPKEVIGKNFFKDIAPCTDVAAFRGRLDALAERGETTYLFDFDFAFPWGLRRVRIRFLIEPDGHRWVFVTDVT
jgi:photoactive yellow protein